MLGTLRNIGVIGLTTGFLAFTAPGLGAQEVEMDKLTVDVRAGGALPGSGGGSYRETVDPGASIGIGASYKVHPRFNLRIDGDVEFLGGDDRITVAGAEFPDQRLWHYNAGVEVRILPERKEPWKLHANLGVGATTMSVDEFTLNGEVRDISNTNLALNGSVRAGYEMSRRTDLFVAIHSYRTFVDEEDTAALAALSDDIQDPFASAWTFPIQLGVRYHF